MSWFFLGLVLGVVGCVVLGEILLSETFAND